MTTPAIDAAEVERLLAELVRIPSTNPPGREGAVVAHLCSVLDAAAIAWTTDELEPDRPNLHATIGPPGSPALALNGHSDTMPAGASWTSDPFEPVVRAGVMTGLGACDMKAGLAAMVGVALALTRCGIPLRRALRLDVVVVEEATGRGSIRAAERQPLPEAVVIVEPTSLRLVPVGNGQINVAYTITGVAAHGSTPQRGSNAVAAAAAAIVALERFALERPASSHALIGPETLSIGTIDGGLKTSVVPDRCRFSVDLRIAPGRDPDAAAAEADDVVAAALAGRPGIAWSRSNEIRVPPFETALDDPLCKALARAHRAVLAVDPVAVGMPATTDAAWYAERGVPAVIYGAGDLADAHRADEHVALADVVTASRVLLELALLTTT